MATFVGVEPISSIGQYNPTNLSADLSFYAFDDYPGHVSDIAFVSVGSKTVNLPNSINIVAVSGTKVRTYFDDFYNRIHIGASSLELGNILSEQTILTYIWNSFFTSQTYSTNSTSALDNVTVVDYVTLPYTLKPLEVIDTGFQISASGEPMVDGFIQLNFTPYNLLIHVIGQRVVFWPFDPITTFTESKQWITEVIKARGSEERISHREIPRISLSYDNIFLSDSSYSLAKVLARTLASVPIGIPIWPEIIKLSNLETDQTNFQIDVTLYDFKEGGLVVFYSNYNTYDIRTVASISSSELSITFGLSRDYPSAYLLPITVGYAADGIQLSTDQPHRKTGRINITSTNSSYGTADTFSEHFLGLPVLSDTGLNIESVPDMFTRNMDTVDSIIGDYVKLDIENYTRQTKIYSAVATTRRELHILRRKLDYLKGKYRAFWLPSFVPDIIPVHDFLLSGSAEILIHTGQFTSNLTPHVRVYGSIIANLQVDRVVNNGDGTESLILHSLTTQTITNITKISVLTKVRLDSDNIEYRHEPKGICFVKLPVTEVLA